MELQNTGKSVLTVSEVNSYIKTMMDHDMLLYNIYIRGEISNFKPHHSGHFYLTLKDEISSIRAVMFRSANIRLRFRPENGMKVIAQGRITVYERDGQYQLYINEMQPDGIGALHLAFEQLKGKLQQEGLFAPEKKKPLPAYPERIGVVTSPTGAAIRDILNILRRRYPQAKVFIYPVLVQGDQACYQIAEGIAYFNQTKSVDVIITGRGGGSIEELWAFNEEITARAIAASEIPVVSAVGHETDFTIADFVADLRAPTPSAAAELVAPSQYELRDKVNSLISRLYFAFNAGLENRRMYLNHLVQSASFRNPVDKINDKRILLDQLYRQLEKNMLYKMETLKKSFASLCGKMDALSPLAVLARGYAIVKNEQSNIIKSIHNVKAGEKIDVQFSDGNVLCRVDEIIKSWKK